MKLGFDFCRVLKLSFLDDHFAMHRARQWSDARTFILVLSIFSFSKLTSGNRAIVIGWGAQTQPHLRALRMGRDYS